MKNVRLVVAAIWPVFAVLFLPDTVSAQKPRQRTGSVAPRPAERVGDRELIVAAQANFAGMIRQDWDGGNQEVTAGELCSVTITTKKTLLGSVVLDEQTVDVGDLATDAEPGNSATGGTWELRIYGGNRLQPVGRRKRVVYIDGAPKGPVDEPVVFIVLSVKEGDPQNQMKAMVEALATYRAACMRKR